MQFSVEDMTCNHCKMRIEKALKAIGAEQVSIDLERKVVTVKDAIEEATVREAIVQAGYTVT